jgi:glycosyltransferase involved in cell wall biosynthesis
VNVDWYASGKLGLLLSSFIFAIGTAVLLFGKRVRGEQFVVYTIDMDTFSYSYLPLFTSSVVAEMHDTKPRHFLNRFFFARVKTVVVTNNQIKNSLIEQFTLSDNSLIVEPNGVDLATFAPLPRDTVRATLSIPNTKPIALYAGRFYDWKGLEILVRAARSASDITWYVVGGTREEFMRAVKLTELPSNVEIIGEQTIDALPQWLAAADVLLVLGTKANERSYRHTSPMKVYEYMAIERPVVASKTPALLSFVEEGTVAWYEPDNATNLVSQVRTALVHNQSMIERGRAAAHNHTWDARARRIIARIQQ